MVISIHGLLRQNIGHIKTMEIEKMTLIQSVNEESNGIEK